MKPYSGVRDPALRRNTYKFVTAVEISNVMVEYDRDLRRILIWLLGGSRGSQMRLQILLTLKKRPMNANQLAKHLNVNYRTVIYHLEILERNRLVIKAGSGYGAPYMISDMLESKWHVLEDVMKIINPNSRGDKE